MKFSYLFILCFLIPIEVKANLFGKYNSRYEATEACQKWADKGNKFYLWVKNYYSTGGEFYKGRERNSRSCEGQSSTSQILGLELKWIKDNKTYYANDYNQILFKEGKKVVKRFKY